MSYIQYNSKEGMLLHVHLASLNIDYQITNSCFNKCAFMRKQDFEKNYP